MKEINKHGLPTGFTFYFCFGRNDGFDIVVENMAIVFYFWWISIGFLKTDIEQLTINIIDENKRLKEKIKNVDLAIELSKYVHDHCEKVPHDIGMKLIEIIIKEINK